MKTKILLGVLIVLVLCIVLGFSLPQTGFAIHQEQMIDEVYLENLRVKANLECLKNSHCSGGYDCMNNKCINSNEINLCRYVGLWGVNHKLEIGQPINSVKEYFNHFKFPFLLAKGKIVEINESEEVIEYWYVPSIFVGSSMIKKENDNYLIKSESNSNEFSYIFRFAFLKSVNFSSKNIRGQILRILGKEYVIGEKSTNSIIYLFSDDKMIKLEDGENVKLGTSLESVKGTSVKMIRSFNEKIAMFEIAFNEQGEDKESIRIGESYVDPVFNSVNLSFNNVYTNEFVDVRIGGSCA